MAPAPARSRRTLVSTVVLSLLVATAWVVLVFVPGRHFERARVGIEAAEAELRRPLVRPAIGGAAVDCDARAVLEAPVLAIHSRSVLADVDRWRDVLEPPTQREYGLGNLGEPPPSRWSVLAWADVDRADTAAWLAAARCRTTVRRLEPDEGWRLSAASNRAVLAGLAGLRSDPAACLRATPAMARLIEDASPSDAPYVEDSRASAALSLLIEIGLACAREAPPEEARAVARTIRDLDVATSEGWIADGMRAALVQRARDTAPRQGLGRWMHGVDDAASLDETLAAADRWAAMRTRPEGDRVRALADPDYVTSLGVLVARYTTRGRARLRAYALALEALASTPSAGALLPVPTAIDLVDPLDGTPLGARRTDSGALEIVRAGEPGHDPEVLARAFARP